VDVSDTVDVLGDNVTRRLLSSLHRQSGKRHVRVVAPSHELPVDVVNGHIAVDQFSRHAQIVGLMREGAQSL
jgi:hypothetical protein